MDSAAAQTTAEGRQAPLWRRITGSTWFHLVAAFVVFGLILSFVAKPYLVPSGSMEETLTPGDRVLVNRLAYVGSSPGSGDVIVFGADETWGAHGSNDDGPVKAVLRWIGEVTGFGPSGSHTLIKRIIASPGQTVECCSADGAILIDGEPIDEPYIFNDIPFTPSVLDCESTAASLRCLPPVTVPDDAYLVLGDHRSNSGDGASLCRGSTSGDDGCWRWALRDQIVGKAAVILWPPSRWGVIN